MAEDEKGTSSWYKVPTWNGNPSEWRGFKREMNWWLASLDAQSCTKFNVAARWGLRQFGVVRARIEEYDPEELEGVAEEKVLDPETEELVVVVEADPFAGIRKLMKALEESMGKTQLDRRGELRIQFYQEIKRNAGERISTFCTRFRTLTSDLKREGISLPSEELGWFLRDRMGLDPLRKQLLETALGSKEDYESVEAEALRLFRDIHTADPLYKKVNDKPSLLNRFVGHPGSSHSNRTSLPSSGSSQASTFRSFRSGASSTSSRFGGNRPFVKQALIAEEIEAHGDGGEADEEELVPAEVLEAQAVPSLEEVLQAEAETLAYEIQELEADDSIDPALIDELGSGVEAAAETLVTMREARHRIAEVKKDRGFGGSGGKSSGKGKGKQMHGNQSQAKKVNTQCWDCGERGHWGGDPQCKRPGAGLFKPKSQGSSNNSQPKHVKITEAMNTEHVVDDGEAGVPTPAHEVLVASTVVKGVSLSKALDFDHETFAAGDAKELDLSKDKRFVGALDSACNRTCTGEVWLQYYLKSLEEAPPSIRQLIKAVPETEVFRFGNGGTKTSTLRYRLPMVVGSSLLLVWVSVVAVPSLGLLLGRDFLDAVGAVLSFARKLLRADYLDGSLVRLRQLTAGHFALRLAPSEWPTPGAQRWRKLGQDGVVEVQVSPSDWLSRKLGAHQASVKPEHEHLVAESSIQAADVANSGLEVNVAASQPLAQLAQKMSGSLDPKISSTTSTTRSPTSPSSRSLLKKALQSDAKPSGGVPRSYREEMAANGTSDGHSCRVARPRHALMVAAAAISTLCSFPLSKCAEPGAVAFAKRANGEQSIFGTSPCNSCSPMQRLHGEESPRGWMAEKSAGTFPSLSGGSNVDWNAGRQKQQRFSIQVAEGSNRGGSEGGRPPSRTESRPRGSQVLDRTSGRSSISERRSSQIGKPPSNQHPGEGHGGAVEATMSPHDQGCDGDRLHHSFFKFKPTTSVTARDAARDNTKDIRTYRKSEQCSVKPWSHLRRHSQSAGTTGSEVPSNDESSSPTRHGDESEHSSGVQHRRSTEPRRLHPGRGSSHECRLLRLHGGRLGNPKENPGGEQLKDHGNNPWKIHQEVKPGISQMIADAWSKHERDRQLVSKSAKEVLEAMQVDWKDQMEQALNETFITTIAFPRSSLSGRRTPLMQEIFTTSQRVTTEAQKKGHATGQPLSLETNWDFTKHADREAAKQQVMKEKPFFLVLAFPCGPWSPLMRLRPSERLDEKQAEGMVFIRFCIELAIIQLEGGRHFLIENPLLAMSWRTPEMVKFIEEHDVWTVGFDQCALGLRGNTGLLHKKPTQILTSSEAVREALMDCKCSRDHAHQPVMGGSAITQAAGLYPVALARVLVKAMENQFHRDGRRLLPERQALAAEHGEAGEELSEDGVEEPEEDLDLPSESDGDEGNQEEQKNLAKIPQAIKMAVKRLHENTGHRSNRRLARALTISGAPKEVIQAAKYHRCSVCSERKSPKARRPASLPTPKDVSDQVHVDIFESFDSRDQGFYIIHVIDYASRFQLAELLPNKASSSVVAFFKKRWFPIFGSPRVLVADQGREFISWEFEEMCAERSILLWHIAVQAPHQNGICERGGGTLKAIVGAIVASQSVIGAEEMELAVQEAVSAYNSDINEAGVTPAQAALGKQPRMHGDVLGNFGERLAEHGLIDSRPGLARQIAMREVAKVAMTRLHFSRSIRKASLARSRSTTVTQKFEPGMIVYFFRQTKYNNKTGPSKKKLALKRWHGPGLLVALEGHANAFVSHKGQLTKCALEHLRPASSMEQVAAEVWRDAIEEVVEAALHDLTRQGMTSGNPPLPVEDRAQENLAPSTPSSAPQMIEDRAQLPGQEPETPYPSTGLQQVVSGGLSGGDLPPVQPAEVARAVQGGDHGETPLASRRSSLLSGEPQHSRRPSTSLARPSTPSRMDGIIERAASIGGDSHKRSAEVDPESLRMSEATRLRTYGNESRVFDALILSREEMTQAVGDPGEHPLKKICAEVALERDQPLEHLVQDHGTWRGSWPLPSRSEWQGLLSSKLLWPRGDSELLAVTARKEYKWSQIAAEDRPKYHEAAKAGWQVWVDNEAVEILSKEEAEKVRQRLRNTGSGHKVMVPRFVYTDKHDGLRTPSCPLPLKANARLVVPGYKDVTSWEVRKDAPTASRTSQHLLLTLTASYGWHLMSADVKSAFLKGEEFGPGERELFIENIKGHHADEPKLPLGAGGLARLRKGIFGLADSPRRWYLRLHRSLTQLGWERSAIDAAQWFLWSADHQKLEGVVLSHVDDLLLGGNERARKSLLDLGKELGFGTLEEKCFTYCGKQLKQHDDGSISVSMKQYHENLKPIPIPLHRRKHPESELTPAEHKQLRGLLGSLQWLVAQVRIDQGFALSSIQGESGTIATMLKANSLLKKFKRNPDFALWFRPMKLDGCGLVGISDASLGNVRKNGTVGDEPMERVYSQSGYMILIADEDLLAGREGQFTVLDARSHRLARVCRSTYAAELMGAEETFDVGQYCRGVLAEAQGYSMEQKLNEASIDAIPLTVVVDAKDVFDKCQSDTPSFGSQKSLAFTVSWLRATLRRPNTALRWTATQNMLIDALTKDMEIDHLQNVLQKGRWCMKFNAAFVKQTAKTKVAKVKVETNDVVIGQELCQGDPVLSRLMNLSDVPGWHTQGDIAIHVARDARSFRTPEPRFDPKVYSIRSTYGRFDRSFGGSSIGM